MKYPRKLYSVAQHAWCKNYQGATTFEPLMDEYEAGEQSFVEAALGSVHWFREWAEEAAQRAERNIPGYDEFEPTKGRG